jgi:hypothetical protein
MKTNGAAHLFKAIAILCLLMACNASFATVISFRDDLTILRDGVPWFPIFEDYNLVDSGGTFQPRLQYYDSANAAGFNGVIMMGAGGAVCQYWPWTVSNATSSDVGYTNLCGANSEWRANCNFATPVYQQLNPVLTQRNWNLFDDGMSLLPYNFLAWEDPTRVTCSTSDAVARRQASNNFVRQLWGNTAPFAGYYLEEVNNIPRDFGDFRWGLDDYEALRDTLLEARACIRSVDTSHVIFLNFSPATAARSTGITEDGTVVPLSGPLARQYWTIECNTLASAADIIGVDWPWAGAPRRFGTSDTSYRGESDILDHDALGRADSSVRTMGDYAHYIVDSVGTRQHKPAIFTLNWPGFEGGAEPSVQELKSGWVQCIVAGVKGFAMYSWAVWPWREFDTWIRAADQPIVRLRQQLVRLVMKNVFKPLSDRGVLTARNASTQPTVSAGTAVLEQLTKLDGTSSVDKWTFAVDRSPEGFAWPYTGTFSGYGSPTGPIEVFMDGQDYSQRWIWPTDGSFSDQFTRLQPHIYHIYGGGFHDTIDVRTDLTIPSDKVLNIAAGTLIRVTEGKSITVQGSMVVNGTANAPVRFIAATAGQTWNGIQVNSGGSLVMNYTKLYNAQPECIYVNMPVAVNLNHCLIDGSSISTGNSAALKLLNSYDKVMVVDSTVIENVGENGKGLYVSNCKVSFTGDTIRNCSYDNSYFAQTTGNVRNCVFSGRCSHYSVAFVNATCSPNFRCCTFRDLAPSGGSWPTTVLCLSGTSPSFGATSSTRGGSCVFDDSSASLFTLNGLTLAKPVIAVNFELDPPDENGIDGGKNDWKQRDPNGKLLRWANPSSQRRYFCWQQHWEPSAEVSRFDPADTIYWDFRYPASSEWGLCGGAEGLGGLSVRQDGSVDQGRNHGNLDEGNAPFALALQLEENGEYAQALELFHSLAASSPDLSVRWNAAVHLMTSAGSVQGNFSWIPLLIDSLIASENQTYETYVTGHRLLTSHYLSQRDFTTAIQSCVDLFARGLNYSDSIDVALDLLTVQQAVGFANDAGGSLDQAISSLVPANLRVHSNLEASTLEKHLLDMLAGNGSGAQSAQVVPANYRLYQNYPNPFNPNTEIRFDIPEAVRVEVKIFNSLGQEVMTLIDDMRAAGSYTVMWNGKNAGGESVSSGMYIYQIKASSFTDAKKMLLMK